MRKDDNDSNIRMILKESGLSKTSDQFSTHLNDLILEQSKRKLTQQSEVNQWFAKALTAIAITWLVIFFYYARPFSIQPALVTSVIAFMLGLWVLFALIRKSVISRIDSI